MKKSIVILSALVLFAGVSFGQDAKKADAPAKTEKKADAKKSDKKDAKKADKKADASKTDKK